MSDIADPVEAKPEAAEASTLQRFSLTLPPMQNDALNAMSKTTGLSKTELIRHAVALLNVAISARKKGLSLALTNEDEEVVGHIVSTI